MCRNNPNLLVISGGPGSGKTTVLRELEKFGYQHAPEVARQIIQEQVQACGRALPWDDRETYTTFMLQRSVDSYLVHTPALQPTFSDRGIPDTLGYARLIGLREQGPIEAACRLYRYASLVFVAPPWQEIYEIDTERTQDFAEAQRTYEIVSAVYRECGYTLSELPKRPPPARAQFILDEIREHAAKVFEAREDL